jgi:hypothetical protein
LPTIAETVPGYEFYRLGTAHRAGAHTRRHTEQNQFGNRRVLKALNFGGGSPRAAPSRSVDEAGTRGLYAGAQREMRKAVQNPRASD